MNQEQQTMNMDEDVKMGELKVTREPKKLTTSGIGSCLVIALYEPARKMGALAHAILPSADRHGPDIPAQAGIQNLDPRFRGGDRSGGEDDQSEGGDDTAGDDKKNDEMAKYVDDSIEAMVSGMKHLGANVNCMEARLVGGANMFPTWGADDDIGAKNILSAKKKLKEHGIPLVGESVGGSIGRMVEFCVASGIMTVKITF
jgi:chemotaxis protein CheD